MNKNVKNIALYFKFDICRIGSCDPKWSHFRTPIFPYHRHKIINKKLTASANDYLSWVMVTYHPIFIIIYTESFNVNYKMVVKFNKKILKTEIPEGKTRNWLFLWPLHETLLLKGVSAAKTRRWVGSKIGWCDRYCPTLESLDYFWLKVHYLHNNRAGHIALWSRSIALRSWANRDFGSEGAQ